MTAPNRKAKPSPARIKAGHPPGAAELRRKLFVEALLSNGENVTQAALAAGFSPKSAASQGSRLLKNAKTKAELDRRRSEICALVQLTTERTLREVARLAYSDPRNLFRPDGTLKPIHELDDDTAATIASIEVDEVKAGGAVVGQTKKLKQWDKGQALDKAMKHLGLYEKDNKQPAEEVASAIRDVGLVELRAAFAKRIGASA
jgi:phage terminase small subunit